jgi:hypothetical protein
MAKMVANQRKCITYGWKRSMLGWSPTKENVSLTDGRDQSKDGRNHREYITYRWEISRPGRSSTKENVSLADGRDQSQDDQPKRMYHLRTVEIKGRMVANQRECIIYGC